MTADEDRRQAGQDFERELSKLFGRARSLSLSLAARVHPGLDGASYALLLHIDDFGDDAGRVRAADVVERTGLDKSTVSRQLARLVDLGLVERVADPHDGRARLVRLTETGGRRLASVRDERRRRLRERVADWPTADLREFARLVARLNEDL